jgi:hypothetical protein
MYGMYWWHDLQPHTQMQIAGLKCKLQLVKGEKFNY